MKEETASLSSSSASSETPKRIVGTKKKKPSVAQLKKSGQIFLQDASCFEVAPKLAKCRECRWTQSQRNKKMPNIFCRFYAFRRVRYAKNGQLCVAGFCDPKRDVSQEDLGLWMASSDAAPDNLDDEQSIFLLENLKSDFEQMLKQERLAVEAHEGEGIYFIITAGICLMYIFSFLLFAAFVKSIRLILCSF
jgi:lysine-specific demethylase 3